MESTVVSFNRAIVWALSNRSAIVKCGPLSTPGTPGCSLYNTHCTSPARLHRKYSHLEEKRGNQVIMVTFPGSRENDGTLGGNGSYEDEGI